MWICCNRDEASSSPLSLKDVGLFSSLDIHVQTLTASLAEKSLSLLWLAEATDLLRKMHFQFLLFLRRLDLPSSSNRANHCLDEYLKTSLKTMNLCNLLKSSISGMDKHRLEIDRLVPKLKHNGFPAPTGSCMADIEKLEAESRNLYGPRKRKSVTFSVKNDTHTTNHRRHSSIAAYYVMSVLRHAMATLSMLIFCAVIHPVAVQFDGEFVLHNYSELKFFFGSLQTLVDCFQEKLMESSSSTRPPLVESKVTERALSDIKGRVFMGSASYDQEFWESVKLLKQGGLAMGEGLEAFDSALNKLLREIVDGRSEVLTMIQYLVSTIS